MSPVQNAPLLAAWFENVYVLLAIALGTIVAYVLLQRLMARLSRGGETEQAKAEYRAFPAKHGLSQTQNNEQGQVYEGNADGYRVIVKLGSSLAPQDDRKRAKVRAGYACVSVQCTQPQPAGLQLWRESKIDAARKETRKLNEVIVGDHELDRALIIRGTHAAPIKALICQPEVREKLLEFFDEWPESIVTDYWVKCEDDEGEPGTQLLGTMLFYALDLAKTLDGAKR